MPDACASVHGGFRSNEIKLMAIAAVTFDHLCSFLYRKSQKNMGLYQTAPYFFTAESGAALPGTGD